MSTALDEAGAKELAGGQWDQARWNAATKDAEGRVSAADWNSAIAAEAAAGSLAGGEDEDEEDEEDDDDGLGEVTLINPPEARRTFYAGSDGESKIPALAIPTAAAAAAADVDEAPGTNPRTLSDDPRAGMVTYSADAQQSEVTNDKNEEKEKEEEEEEEGGLDEVMVAAAPEARRTFLAGSDGSVKKPPPLIEARPVTPQSGSPAGRTRRLVR